MTAAATTSKTSSIPPPDSADYAETRSVQLEWKVTNLRQLFDSTKGDVKSKCVKSALFDHARWQIFLYPNSGQEQYVSVYLSAEPTPAERERGLAEQAATLPGATAFTAGAAAGGGGGKEKVPWRRDGHYKFTFEIRSLDRRNVYKTMEPDDNHAFNSSYRNWGYAQMISRRDAYYNNPAAKAADAFLIICTIVSTPTLPSPPPSTSSVPVPKDLVRAYASLFDDPDYSDVVFRIRPESGTGRKGGKVKEKRLYAAKKILAGRSEYFEMMFSSGFSEAALPSSSHARRSRSSSHSRRPRPSSTVTELDDEGEISSSSGGEDEEQDEEDESSSSGETDPGWDEDDDSGDEEEEDGEGEAEGKSEYEDGTEGDAAHVDLGTTAEGAGTPTVAFPSTAPSPSVTSQAPASPDLARSTATIVPGASAARRSRTSSASLTDEDEADAGLGVASASAADPSTSSTISSSSSAADVFTATEHEHATAPSSPPAPSTPAASRHSSVGAASAARFVDAQSAPGSPVKAGGAEAGGRRKDAEKKKRRGSKKSTGDGRARFEVVVTDAAWSTYRSLLHYLYTDAITFSPLASTYYVARDRAASSSSPSAFPYASRREYLLAHSPSAGAGAAGEGGGKAAAVGPASSKAIYRLADKMGLQELKERANEHIVKSLTAENIVYEVFGSFSQRFDEIRQVEIAFLLQHWNTVRASPQMREVFDYLRTGRFPGFEDVWIELVQCLEVRPSSGMGIGAGGAGAEGRGGGAQQAQGEEGEGR
ncbi:hypothetical protein JCM6882_005959 [Rhodosporidiobolus microsporus]